MPREGERHPRYPNLFWSGKSQRYVKFMRSPYSKSSHSSQVKYKR